MQRHTKLLNSIQLEVSSHFFILVDILRAYFQYRCIMIVLYKSPLMLGFEDDTPTTLSTSAVGVVASASTSSTSNRDYRLFLELIDWPHWVNLSKTVVNASQPSRMRPTDVEVAVSVKCITLPPVLADATDHKIAV
jgi:hypothetical protein